MPTQLNPAASVAMFSQAGLACRSEMSPGSHTSGQEAAAAQEVQDALRLSKILLGGGRSQEAQMVVDRTVAKHPAHTELLHLRGKCLEAANNTPAAFATYLLILNIDPVHVPALLSVGGIYKARGLLQEALAALTKAHEAAPNDQEVRSALAVVITDLGTRAKVAGDAPAATEHYLKAVELAPTYAPALYNVGVMHSEARQLDLALEWYGRAVAAAPGYAEAHCNMGVILKERGQLEAAVAAYERALAASPNLGVVQANLAVALTDLGTKLKLEGRVDEGVAAYERALALNPKYPEALYNLGVAYSERGQLDRAIFMYETCVAHAPQCAEAHNNLGVLYRERDNVERAVQCYNAALQARPDFPQSLNNLGVLFTTQGRAQEALTLLTAAIQSCPTYAEAHNNLGVLQRDVGAIKEAIASYSRCLELQPDSRNAGQNRLLALNYIIPGEDAQVSDAHAEWGERFQRLFTPLPPLAHGERDLSRDRVLRVGYISPDLFTHSVSYFAEAPLSHHSTPARAAAAADAAGSAAAGADAADADAESRQEEEQRRSSGAAASSSSSAGAAGTGSSIRAQVQPYVYCCTPRRDAKSGRLRAAVEAVGGVWREVTQLRESDLAALVRQDQIDILVELTGHTANNRLGVMAMQPAPVQVTWIGYPNSTGLKAVQYRFTDAVCDPEDTKQAFVEELVRLPGCFLCYTPAVDAPPVSPLPASTAGYITFGSFNNLAKITPQVLKVWARILHAVPRSRLVLKNKPFACDTARNHFFGLLGAEGIEPWRVDLLPLAAANSDHLSTYSLMDISLDPWPYAGTTTTCESLFMGVPCVTLAGACHAHNVGVSLLAAVGIREGWVAESEDEYVAVAAHWASDIPRLAALRAGLRQRMLSSPMCDAPMFMEGLEATYRGLWHRYVDSVAGEQQQPRAGASAAGAASQSAARPEADAAATAAAAPGGGKQQQEEEEAPGGGSGSRPASPGTPAAAEVDA